MRIRVIKKQIKSQSMYILKKKLKNLVTLHFYLVKDKTDKYVNLLLIHDKYYDEDYKCKSE